MLCQNFGYLLIQSLFCIIGSLSIKNSPDFETQSQYNLLIDASDNGNPPKAAYARVTVIIEDVNDHAPQFNQSDYSFEVSEGTSIRGKIGSVVATDRDSGPLGRVIYSIKGGDGDGVFTIDGSTGKGIAQYHTMSKKQRIAAYNSKSNHDFKNI